MRRAVLILTVALFALQGLPADAARNPRPRVAIASVEPIQPGPEGTTEYRIRLEAADPDGIISELFLDFGDGVVLSMLLICTEPGETIVQEVTWSYAPGKYKLRAWGFSTSGCFEGTVQESRRDSEKIKVA